jgi:uncharacterized protein YdeI (YjbR/CyaY-like superfamily)
LGQNRASSGRGWPQNSHSMAFSILGATDPKDVSVPLGDSIVMEPTTFERPQAFRAWLEQHHDSEPELWVGYYKRGSGKPSMTWPESVDEALCYGWIDGIRKSIDAEAYMIRFTPRRARSIWSAVNIARVAVLTDEGRMRPAGLEAFEARREDRSGIYSYEQRDRAKLEQAYEKRFRAKKKAWAAFETMPKSYRKAAIRWVMTAKKEETRERRLAALIEDSAAGRTVPPLTRR